MHIISVDDEELTIKYLERLLHQVEPDSPFVGFTEAEDALEYLAKNKVDVALLDIEMGRDNGIDLAQKCRELCPQLNVIFVTGYSQYTLEAFKLHASGYLLKPVRANDLKIELDNLRHPPKEAPPIRVRVQTFGNFEVFVDEKPLSMPSSKCRECLAYLIDRRGARVTVAELAGVLWEDVPYSKKVQNNTYRITSDLMRYLKEAGIEEIIFKNRKEIAINKDKIDCDYYRFLDGDAAQMKAFLGEYMSNYAWAEFTLAELAKVKEIRRR